MIKKNVILCADKWTDLNIQISVHADSKLIQLPKTV